MKDKTCYPHCASPTVLEGIQKLNPKQISSMYCAAFEVFPDHSHITAFPVNCSAKYWSRLLCQDKQSIMGRDAVEADDGYGEYLIDKNTLIQRKYICQSGFYSVIDEFCMKVVLSEKPNNKEDSWKFFHRDHCNSSVNKLFQKFEIKYNNIATLYILTEILDEFYAEGSDLFLKGVFFATDSFYVEAGTGAGSSYFWLPTPNYPTYLPCFKSREKVEVIRSNDISWFGCDDGAIIADVLVCNGKSDCRNSEDERQCSVCPHDNSFFPPCICSIFHYMCQSGGCVHYDHVCDSISDCPDGDDETFCHVIRTFPHFSGKVIKSSFIIDLCDPPSGDMIMCKSKLQCYNSSDICYYDHSDGIMAYCEDGSHIGRGSLCRYVECIRHYKYQRSYCIPTRKVCDGIIDCPVGDDEADCEGYKCPGHMRCHGVTYCVPPYEMCDGISHRPQQEDEKYCQVCPQLCQCLGTAVYCSNVTSINNNLYSPSALILYNSYSIFEKLYADHFSKLNNVWLIDLRWGSFYAQLENEVKMQFESVKFLYLNHQSLYVLPSYFIKGPNIIYANFSYNVIGSVHKNAFSFMNNIKVLVLVSNKIASLETHFCNDLRLLSQLYLTDNPLKHISGDVFVKNTELSVIRSDWYIVCCVGFTTSNCQPQNQFVSSCSNLISSVVQITAIITQGIMVIIGNVGALFIHCTVPCCAKAEKCLVVSLILADLLMGFYLLVIAAVDLIYNAIFYQIVSEWTSSITCLSLGLINFVSSEVSLLILSILSFARMISIDKIGGMAFIKMKVRIACAMVWVVILVIGICYIVYLFIQNMGARNNMCILLGISQKRYVTPLEYIFQVAIFSCNMLLLFTIFVSMLSLFHCVIKSYHSVLQSSSDHAKSQHVRLIRIGLRLLLLLASNILTWLPVLIVSILLLRGTVVHENVLQWIIVLSIPICSCADPFLYNLASLKAHLNKK